jgi:hypothetical protein
VLVGLLRVIVVGGDDGFECVQFVVGHAMTGSVVEGHLFKAGDSKE